MYIEFNLASDQLVREIAQQILRNEFAKWCHQHNLSYNNLVFELVKGWNKERVYLPSDRAYELFCVSWAPANPHFESYILRRG